MPDVVMPRLSDSMEEGTILKWLVADGARVARGQVIAEIETDKATMTFEADADGALQIVAVEGATVPIGTLIARISADGDAQAAATAPPAPGTAKGQTTVEELSRAQQAMARRVAESRATVPDVAFTAEVDMQACVALREQLRSLGDAPSFADLAVKASAIALRDFPRANGSYKDARFELHGRVNVGVAVPTDTGFVTPTVFDADTKSLEEIAAETSRLTARVRSGEITPPELSGGTFTVNDLGAYGVTRFAAVITPPQAAILALGAVSERAVVRDGAVVARHAMDMTLACDHRILYGEEAARFLGRIRELLEQPLALTR